jgi:glutamyl-tRNA(Gln) amidotransferase subunit E
MKKREIAKRHAAKEHETDYSAIGLKAGLEIHQRLATRKLFCECDSAQRAEPTAQFVRRLRPVKGELGGIDPAALSEFIRNKSFIYKASPAESCHVELDEEPPHDMNADALKIGLQMAKLTGCTVPDEIHVMRKTVIDGSNTGGFQRTAVIGFGGSLKMEKGKETVINQIAIEEESGRIELKSEGEVTYMLSGLGIPLLEITTGVIEGSPQQVLEAAKKIGLLLRSLPVQRGIGSIRQDINVSVAGGARIEIKGFQQLEDIPKIIENEAKRQLDLLKLRDELVRRGIRWELHPHENETTKGLSAKRMSEGTEFFKESISSHESLLIRDVTELFKKTENYIIRRAVLDDAKVLAILLPGFGGLLKQECGDRTLGKELSAYAKAYGLGGMIHTDEDLAKYKLVQEFAQIKKDFEAAEKQPAKKAKQEIEDAIVVLAAHAPAVRKAAEAILKRARHCMDGVPEETRVADGTGTVWARPLPGSARMYPETDIPPIRITREALAKLELPKTLLERGKDLEKLLPKELRGILTSPYFSMFDTLSKEFDPVLVANTFENLLKDIKRRGFDTDKLKEEHYHGLFKMVKSGEIPQDVLSDALLLLVEGKSLSNVKAAFQRMPEPEVRQMVERVVKAHRAKGEGAMMGMLMGQLRGRCPGELVARLLREELARVR